MSETRWPAALGRRGVVCSPHPLATLAGLQVLQGGGTAVDAAVAVGATIAVVYPHMTGLGGDSFWLCWDARAARLVASSRGRAAARATPELYRRHGLAAIPARGPLAALTVPGASMASDRAPLEPRASRLDDRP
jgi:gamma-glutamyltranspeptidase/glutathione hydrolase